MNLRVPFDGEQEIGSPAVPVFAGANARRLSADMIFSADGPKRTPDQPQIAEAQKRLVAVELVVYGPRRDQHSGLHGGGIAGFAILRAEILASMKSPTDG
jgi:acetylornithine deacetylase/succinyl-diaminopimelate desuccinylase-like protein